MDSPRFNSLGKAYALQYAYPIFWRSYVCGSRVLVVVYRSEQIEPQRGSAQMRSPGLRLALLFIEQL